jgi:ribonuclease HI
VVDTSELDLVIDFDGSCRPNPGGKATWGIVARNRVGEVVLERGGAVGEGPNMSNNAAEYAAATKTMEAIEELAPIDWKIKVRGDSQIVI